MWGSCVEWRAHVCFGRGMLRFDAPHFHTSITGCFWCVTPVLAFVIMQMSVEQAKDYCKRKTTFVQKQQQGVQKVRRVGGSTFLDFMCDDRQPVAFKNSKSRRAVCYPCSYAISFCVSRDGAPTTGCAGAEAPADASDRSAQAKDCIHAGGQCSRRQRSGMIVVWFGLVEVFDCSSSSCVV